MFGRRKDGSDVPIEVGLNPIRTEDGLFVLSAIVDITERKKANEAIRRSREQLMAAEEVGRVGGWEWDIPGNQVTWTDQMYRLYGLRPGEVQVTYETFLERVHPDDREMVDRTVKESYATLKPFSFEHRAVHPDGSAHWLHGSGRVVADEQGRAVRMVGSGQDITDLRKAEAEVRSLAQFPAENPNPVIRVTGKGRVLYANLPARDLLADMGWAPDGPLVAPLAQAVRRVIADGGKQEIELPAPAGRVFWFVLAPNVGDAYVNLYGSDITALKRAEETLRKLNQELEDRVGQRTEQLWAANRELRAMGVELGLAEERERRRLAVELHDGLCQTLNVAKIKLQRLKRSPRAMGSEELMSGAQELVSRAEQEARSLTFHLSPAALYEFGFVAGVGSLVDQMSKQYGLEVTFEDGRQPISVPEQMGVVLYRCVRELLINVAKHAGVGRALLRLNREPQAIRIVVQDEGDGFDVAATLTPDRGSLGLSIVRERIGLLGGQCDIQSAPGAGTTVSVVVPVPADGDWKEVG